jgi:inner membrane protein
MKDANKNLFKGAIIIILIALLMIPTWYVNGLVMERKLRKDEITQEVYKTWSKPQIISAPYLQLSYAKNNSAENIQKYNAYVMASSNKVEATVNPIIFHRNIYNVPVYSTVIQLSGSFDKKDIETFTTTNGTINNENSNLAFNITDIKGVADSVTAEINNKTYLLNAKTIPGGVNTKSFCIPYALLSTEQGDINYKIKLTLKGSEKISFLPLAAVNNIHLKSNWPNPAFEGSFATENKTITSKGFDATWNITKYQTSISTINDIWPANIETTVGVNLITPVDAYTKIMRCTKYALLFIALTFALFYFIEILKNTQIHPVQYVLVGLAIVIFFTLLLSISEYIGFDWAYVIAALATITLITTYCKSIMHTYKNAFTVGVVQIALYAFIYNIIQLEDTSLLVGSIGLFIILAIIMQVSKKINWGTINLFNTNKN